MEVVDWKSFDDCEGMPDYGRMGGWFNADSHLHNTWMDYIDGAPHDWLVRAETLREEILKKRIRRGGDWHQEEGTPVLSDGSCFRFSMRGWGDLLAAIWSEEDGLPYSYLDFYMDMNVRDHIDSGWVAAGRPRELNWKENITTPAPTKPSK